MQSFRRKMRDVAWLLFWHFKGMNPFWARDLLTEIMLARLFIHDGDTVLDIGASVGQYSLLFRTLVGDNGIVLAFEPNPIARRIHSRNMKRRNLTNVRVYPYALSSSSRKMVQLKIDLLSISETSSIEPVLQSKERMGTFTHKVNVITVRLDDLLFGDDRLTIENNTFPLPTFMKVDVEGHETDVFKGGTSFLRRCRPVILFEHRAKFGDIDVKPIGLLEETGYVVLDICNFEKVHEPFHMNVTRNLFAVPEERYALFEPVASLLRCN